MTTDPASPINVTTVRAVVRVDGRTLVRLERRAETQRQWSVYADVICTSAYVGEQIVADYTDAALVAKKMAQDIQAYEAAVTLAQRELQRLWPPRSVSA